MKMNITYIAKRANVSKATVSRVLNNKPDVDAETRERILAIIAETGYRPGKMAVGLSTGRTNLIGLLVPSLSSPYSLEVIQGVAEGIEESDYELVLYTTSLSEFNQRRFSEALSRSLTDGIVVLLPRSGLDELEKLYSSSFPVVLIDHRAQARGLPGVSAANRQGAYDGACFLLKTGAARPAFITGLMDFGVSRERLEGFRQAAQEAGLSEHNCPVIEGDFSQISGYSCALELLRDQKPPDAIFACNDEMALGVLEAARVLGLKVPEQLMVLGFDDIPAAARSVPPLTTIRQPLREMGRIAVESLIRQIEQKTRKPEDNEIVLPTELIVRGTTRRSM